MLLVIRVSQIALSMWTMTIVDWYSIALGNVVALARLARRFSDKACLHLPDTPWTRCLFGFGLAGILVYAVMTALNALTIGTYFTLVVDCNSNHNRVTD